MFTIDLTLKTNPIPLSVQRKTEEDAHTLYQTITSAMQAKSSEPLELTCDRQPEKRITVLADQICAVQISQKNSGSAAGKPPGFFSALTEE